MTADEILQAVGEEEGLDREFKSAQGGVPGSFWETYSAFANSEGGVIVLGVEEKKGAFRIVGVPEPAKARKSLWDTLNNRGKVSANLLNDRDVETVEVGGCDLLVVRVRKATRKEKPIYLDQRPLERTFRRNYEGDYRCNPDEVGRMLADQNEEPADGRILPGFGFDDLDAPTLAQYRNRFASRDPDHAWLAEDDRTLLEKLGGWRRDRVNGEKGITVAGLLMFGRDEAIRDASAVPEYHVDYREELSEDPEVRWTDRITADGRWAGNLFQFYRLALARLTQDLAVPFRLSTNLYRQDETSAHEAIREALVNALIHADYRGQGGIVVRRRRGGLEFSNPGSLLISLRQLREGGVTDCRNKSLQKMFQMIGAAEKAGSGVDKIFRGWREHGWSPPDVETRFDPDRVVWRLPLVGIVPDEVRNGLRAQFGEEFDRLNAHEVAALATAAAEGRVSNARLRLGSDLHPADISRMLQSLVQKGFLLSEGERRTTAYRLPPRLDPADSLHNPADSLHNPADSLHNPADSLHNPGDSSNEELFEAARPARETRRLAPQQMRELILDLCRDRWLSAADLAGLLSRDADHLRNRLLAPLVTHGRLEMRFPDSPNSPGQAYRTRGAERPPE